MINAANVGEEKPAAWASGVASLTDAAGQAVRGRGIRVTDRCRVDWRACNGCSATMLGTDVPWAAASIKTGGAVPTALILSHP
jgi:hypothetical protein